MPRNSFHDDQVLISTNKIFRSQTLIHESFNPLQLPVTLAGLALTAISIQKVTSLHRSVFEFAGPAVGSQEESYGSLQGPSSFVAMRLTV